MFRNFLEYTSSYRFLQQAGRKRGSRLWTLLTVCVALLVSLPVLTVLYNLMLPGGDIWPHLASTVLPDYVQNSIWLMIGV
ncbi:MAG: hypothetical protein WD094_00830, partial [Balneolaceae bacterium]